MRYFTEDYLAHHGILGQKWGVRRYQNKDGSLTAKGKKRYAERTNYGREGGAIPKGTKLYRVAYRDPTDRTWDNKKYFSTSKYDHAKWEQELDYGYAPWKDTLYALSYKTVKEIQIAPEPVLGSTMKNFQKANAKQVSNDVKQAYRMLYGREMSKDNKIPPSEAASLCMAAQVPTGKEIRRLLENSGYGAVADVHGWNVADDPIIVFDPDSKTRKTFGGPKKHVAGT